MGDDDEKRDSVAEEFKEALGNTPRRVAKIAAALAVVATLLGYGVGIGKLMQRVDRNEKDVATLLTAKDTTVEALHRLDTACRERTSAVADAARDSMMERDMAIGELHSSVIALSTEVRVRHNVKEYTDVVAPPGERVSQREREKLATTQSNQALRAAIMAAPGNTAKADPLDAIATEEGASALDDLAF